MGKLTMITLSERIEELEARLKDLEDRVGNIKTRDYGPKSERSMTDELAEEIIKLKMDDPRITVRQIADDYNLSRGQVYSLLEGYTFKRVWKRIEEAREALKSGTKSSK